MNQRRRPRVLWMTNLASPYRIPVWRALAREVDLDVHLVESTKRLERDTAANRGSDWARGRIPGATVTEVKTLRVARGEARYYALIGLPRWRPDAVLLGGWESPAYWQMLALAKIRRVRTVGFYESTLATHRHTSGPIAALRRRFFRSVDAVVVPGLAAEEAVRALGVSSDKIAVGFNAVDVSSINEEARAARAAAPADAGHHFVFVGQLIERKGVDLLIDAFASMSDPDDTLTIIGMGPLDSELRERCARAGLSGRVDFGGYVPNASLPSVIARKCTLVMPSREEVWGLVANEALAAGLHVVVTEIAGVAPSIASMPGVHLTATNVASLAEAMSASKRDWNGPIDNPQILTFGPDEFAATFLGALIPTESMRGHS